MYITSFISSHKTVTTQSYIKSNSNAITSGFIERRGRLSSFSKMEIVSIVISSVKQAHDYSRLTDMANVVY